MYATWFHMDALTMNRQFKFRVWDNNQKRFENPAHLEVFHSTGELEYLYDSKKEYTIIQQYTGFKDKEHCEIFEGDLVNFDFKIEHGDNEEFQGFVVIWDQYLGMWSVEEDHDIPKYEFGFHEIKNIKVVGNIFEKKEKQ